MPYGTFAYAMLSMAQRCEPSYSFSGVVGFEYASIKDSIKELGLSVKRHRKAIAYIGKLVAMDKEAFTNLGASTQLDDITKEDIQKMFKIKK